MVALFTAGGIIVDTVIAADGTVGPQTMGGNAVYSAAGARLWIDAVGIVGRVPSNYPPGFLDRLGDGGIDLSGVSSVDEAVHEGEWFFYSADGSRADHLHAPMDVELPFAAGIRLSPAERDAFQASLAVTPSTGREFASFRRRNPVRMEDVPRSFGRAKAAHLAANHPQQQCAMAQALRGMGMLVSIDPGSNAAAYATEGLEPILRAASAFLPSEKELSVLAPGLGAAEGLQHLRSYGPALGIAKLGARGSMILAAEGEPRALPVYATQALDPTGAGDAFCGGFLAGLLLSGDPLAAACLGTVSASFAVEDFGPFHLLATSRRSAMTRLAAFLETLDHELADGLKPTLSRMEMQ